VFVLPGLLAILAFALYPSLYQVRLALHRGDGLGPMTWVGAENFLRILRPGTPGFDSVFWSRVLPNTFAYMLVVTAGQLALGLLLASLLNLPLRANRVYRVLFFIPLVTSLATVSVILIGLLKGEQSGLNEFLRWIGLGDLPYRLGLVDRPGAAHDWLGPRTDLGTLMAVAIWHGLPYTIILMLAGLQSISPELYEAAKVDGAGAWGRFAHITLPEMAPLLAVIAFTSLVGAARAFSLVFVMTEGGVAHSSELVATYLFKWGFMRPDGREADLGYASALGIVYAAMLAVLTFANVAMIARR
jgi:ABC-type sugar transport system permease subunit